LSEHVINADGTGAVSLPEAAPADVHLRFKVSVLPPGGGPITKWSTVEFE
jgi:hypothetical protein